MLQDQYPAQPRILADDDADREAVPSALPGASMAHLACHGYSDPADPSSSRLLLGDGETLTVLDLSTVRRDNPGLAFLSAYATAMSTEALADESINLAAAFQLAGFGHVIANLWPVADVMASKISAGFYAALTRTALPPPTAPPLPDTKCHISYATNSPTIRRYGQRPDTLAHSKPRGATGPARRRCAPLTAHKSGARGLFYPRAVRRGPGSAQESPGRREGSRPCRRTRSLHCTAGSIPARVEGDSAGGVAVPVVSQGAGGSV